MAMLKFCLILGCPIISRRRLGRSESSPASSGVSSGDTNRSSSSSLRRMESPFPCRWSHARLEWLIDVIIARKYVFVYYLEGAKRGKCRRQDRTEEFLNKEERGGGASDTAANKNGIGPHSSAAFVAGFDRRMDYRTSMPPDFDVQTSLCVGRRIGRPVTHQPYPTAHRRCDHRIHVGRETKNGSLRHEFAVFIDRSIDRMDLQAGRVFCLVPRRNGIHFDSHCVTAHDHRI